MTADATRPEPESVNDYLARIVAAAPPITADHPAAAVIIRYFRPDPADRKRARKTA